MALYRIGCHRNFHCRNKLIFLKVLGTNRYLQAFDPNEREKAITILLQSSSLWKNVLIRKVQLQPFPSDSSLLLTSAFTASEQNYHVRDGFEKRVPGFIHFVDCYQGSTHPVDNPVSLALFPNHTLCMPLSQTFLPHTLFIEACKTLGRTANVNFISIWVHSHRAKFVRQIISFFLTTCTRGEKHLG